MAEDLVTDVHRQLQSRLRELQPLVEEYARLQRASDALASIARMPAGRKRAPKPRHSKRSRRPRPTPEPVPVSELSWTDLGSVDHVSLDAAQQEQLEKHLGRAVA